MKKIKIFPSLISSNVLNLEHIIAKLEPYCDGFHVDVMDNHFVPNLTWGPLMVNAIAQCSTKPLFVHLMVDKPENITQKLKLKPNSILSFHVESTKNAHELIHIIQEEQWIPNIAIKPQTPLEYIFQFLEHNIQVLLMSVEPGFSGQQLLPEAIQRLKKLNEYRTKMNLHFEVAMDGGINLNNIAQLAKNGCTIFGIASAIFSADDPIKAIEQLYNKAQTP